MTAMDLALNRKSLTHYLKGSGIEIGALHFPVRFAHDGAKVRYVDCMPAEELQKQYPDLTGIVNADLISHADDLSIISEDSLDFVIANHVIEHMIDPIGALGLWHSKLRENGVLFMAYPLPGHCLDRVRPLTRIEHLIEDHGKSVASARDEHLLAFTWAWNPGYFKSPDEIKAVLEHLWRSDSYDMDDTAWGILNESRANVEGLLALNKTDRIELHQHTFSFDLMVAVLEALASRDGKGFTIEDISFTKGLLSEHVLILRKRGGFPPGGVMADHAYAALEREILIESTIREYFSWTLEDPDMVNNIRRAMHIKKRIVRAKADLLSKLNKIIGRHRG